MTSNRSASLLIGLALLAGPFCLPAAAHAAEAGSAALDFELSDGRAFVRLAELPKQVTVVNFWRSDCPPCVREMPLLADTARQGKSQVVAIALQRPYETANAVYRALCHIPITQAKSHHATYGKAHFKPLTTG